MKNILLLLMLLYCNSFELIGLKSLNHNFFNSPTFSFFNIISKTTAQSISREHQHLICQKLRAADFNHDGVIDSADYSLLYLVAMKDQTTLENMKRNSDLFALMDLSLDFANRSIASKVASLINENDVAIFYNFLTDKIPYCPYRNNE